MALTKVTVQGLPRAQGSGLLLALSSALRRIHPQSPNSRVKWQGRGESFSWGVFDDKSRGWCVPAGTSPSFFISSMHVSDMHVCPCPLRAQNSNPPSHTAEGNRAWDDGDDETSPPRIIITLHLPPARDIKTGGRRGNTVEMMGCARPTDRQRVRSAKTISISIPLSVPSPKIHIANKLNPPHRRSYGSPGSVSHSLAFSLISVGTRLRSSLVLPSKESGEREEREDGVL